MKKIVIAIPVLFWGGTEIQTLTLIRVIMSMGFEVTICCYHEYDMTMVKRMKDQGAEVILMEIDRSSGLFNLFIHLKKLFRQIKPEAVHVRYIAPGLIPILAARSAGVKRIFATVGQLGSPYGFIPKIFIRFSAVFADCLICTSQQIEQSWFGNSGQYAPRKYRMNRKHITIYNGIDIKKIVQTISESDPKQLREELKIRHRNIVSVVGRLRWEKGQGIILEAFKQIVSQCPDTVLIFAGDGPDTDILKKKTKSAGIEDNVIFTGNLSQKYIYRLYGISDIVAVPSLYEGFGLTAIEAMAASVPVVASDVGGLKEIIEEGITGYLFPVSDSPALAEKILMILKSPDLSERMRKMSFKRVSNLFSFEKYSEKMICLYKYFLGIN